MDLDAILSQAGYLPILDIISSSDLQALLLQAAKQILLEPNLVKLSGPIVVAGLLAS